MVDNMEVVPGVYIGSIAAVDEKFGLILNLSGVKYRASPGQTVGTVKIHDRELQLKACRCVAGCQCTANPLGFSNDAAAALRIFIRGAEAIEAARAESIRTKILVHCAAGINRSAATIAIWLVRNGFGYAEAMQVLTEANIRRGVPVLTNQSFREIIKSYAEFHGKCPYRYW